jgi:hypothetical protein
MRGSSFQQKVYCHRGADFAAGGRGQNCNGCAAACYAVSRPDCPPDRYTLARFHRPWHGASLSPPVVSSNPEPLAHVKMDKSGQP